MRMVLWLDMRAVRDAPECWEGLNAFLDFEGSLDTVIELLITYSPSIRTHPCQECHEKNYSNLIFYI